MLPYLWYFITNMILFRSKITQKLLAYFFLNPHQEHYVHELASLLNVDPKNLHTKLKAFEKEGLFSSHFKGKERYYSLNPLFPLLKEYQQIFQKTLGVEPLIKASLSKIPGIQSAYLFGSYAADRLHPSSDIDLLVVGSHLALDVQRAVLPIQKRLQREVNVVDMSNEEFKRRRKEKDPFLHNIFSFPVVQIV